MRFYVNAATGKDQLRQRVALALSELVVASETDVHTTAGQAAFSQVFLDHAFGNYRDLLKAVTLNPYMADYLHLAQNTRNGPNEDYAREVMQLFSLGVDMLNLDGTVQKDASGAPIPAYGPQDVRDIARALTGWTYARLNDGDIRDAKIVDYTRPLIQVPQRHDNEPKSFLGRTTPANLGQNADLEAVIDAIFKHPNVAPYVGKFLIQQLVMSNPPPSYVERVARIFNDNGAGVRGDLKSVVRAVLTDVEARTPRSASSGKVKEPVIYAVSLARAIGVTATDGYAFTRRDFTMGQEIFRAPSVFSYYPIDYPLAEGNGLVSGPSKLETTATILARHNIGYDWTLFSDRTRDFDVLNTMQGATGTTLNWTAWEKLGTDVDAQLDRINLVMLANGMTPAQRASVRDAMLAVRHANAATQARRRAQVALYVAATSPLFQVDR